MKLAVEFRNISKRFGSVRANQNISFEVAESSIHAIVGENGAGKSTLMKILFGMVRPDAGEVWVRGIRRRWNGPIEALDSGLGMVHQHFMLSQTHNAIENLVLGMDNPPSRFSFLPEALQVIDLEETEAVVRSVAESNGFELDWNSPVGQLSVGEQQKIEILKLLLRNSGILILDEPTAVLNPKEIEDLFERLIDLKKRGKTVILITHKLKEVMKFADRVTVIRSGEVIGTRETLQTNEGELAELMVGRKVNLEVSFPESKKTEELALEVKGLKSAKLKIDDLKINQGEIVGIAGVEGNGQSELLDFLMCPNEFARTKNWELERYFLLGNDARSCDSKRIRSLGVGLIPEDRIEQGVILENRLDENFVLGHQDSTENSRYGMLNWSRIRSRVTEAIRKNDIRPADYHLSANQLSGGNQQKLIIARELMDHPKFLIASQPTRGVDVGAIEFIHKAILDVRSSGAGVLLVSSELDEVLSLSDRILVIFQGRFLKEFNRDSFSEKEIGLAMGGVT